MAKRYSGRAVVTVTYKDDGAYRAVVAVGGKNVWRGSIAPPWAGYGPGISYDSPAAYDRTARAALSFAMDERAIDDGDIAYVDARRAGEEAVHLGRSLATRYPKHSNPGRKAKARGTKRGTKTTAATRPWTWNVKVKGDREVDWYETKGAALRAGAARARRVGQRGSWIEVRKGHDVIRAYTADARGKFSLAADYEKGSAWTEGAQRQLERKNIRAMRAVRKGARRAAKRPRPTHRIVRRARPIGYGDI